jgi:glycosyltransferase involved in cell wall biosynthesis
MRVLMTTDTVGGVLTYTAELAAALEALGDEVTVATMGPPLEQEQRTRLPSRLHQSGLRLEWMEDPWGDVNAARDWLLSLEDELCPDVVHLCSYAHGSAPFQAPKLVVAHSCVLSWWRGVRGAEAPPSWNRYRAAMGAGLLGADAVVAPTRAMLRELERDHGAATAGGLVIYNGSAAPEASAGVEKYPVVIGSGRFWDPAKNLTALDAAAEGLSWPVVVAGELSPGGGTVHAASTGVLGPSRLARLRRSAAIYAAPALYEPFGLGILEAARDRCALVLGDIPTLRELWEDAAVFVDPRDHNALRAALQQLIDDDERRDDLAARAQGRAAGYSVARAARAYRHLYARLRSSDRERVAV